MEDVRSGKDQPGLREIPVPKDLIPGIVHKLNNHMAPIIGYAQLLALKTIDPGTKKDLEKIIAEAKEATQIIQDLPLTLLNIPTTQFNQKREKEKTKSIEKRSIGEGLRGTKGLIIDDDTTFLDFVSKFLELEGCVITAVPDATIALDLVEIVDFDFVICDIQMPRMNGSDFHCTIKEQKPSLADRIIFSTGDALTKTTQVFIDSVTNPYIKKPFNLNQLKEVIFSVLC
jgi:CheY-like chemotaxis protein